MSKVSPTANDGKDKSADVKPGSDPQYDKANTIPEISDDKFGHKPKFKEAEAGSDPWKGKGGAFDIDEVTGLRVPVEVPYEPNRPMPPDAMPAPEEPSEEAPQDKTPK